MVMYMKSKRKLICVSIVGLLALAPLLTASASSVGESKSTATKVIDVHIKWKDVTKRFLGLIPYKVPDVYVEANETIEWDFNGNLEIRLISDRRDAKYLLIFNEIWIHDLITNVTQGDEQICYKEDHCLSVSTIPDGGMEYLKIYRSEITENEPIKISFRFSPELKLYCPWLGFSLFYPDPNPDNNHIEITVVQG